MYAVVLIPSGWGMRVMAGTGMGCFLELVLTSQYSRLRS
jgi:hypothetical protein